MHYTVNVHNACTIVNGQYQTSSYYQPQKFALGPYISDREGKTYGDLSGTVFGCRGKIHTSQPMISRYPKTAADVAYTKTQTGTTHSLSEDRGTFGVCSIIYRYGADTEQHYDYYLHDHQDIGNDFAGNASHGALKANNVVWTPFPMTGPYNTSAEPGFNNDAAGTIQLVNVIEELCARLGSSSWSSRLAVTSPQYSDDLTVVVEADRMATQEEYDTNHHDYT